MQNNENMKVASLSSWNYGTFSCINPYYSQRNIKYENKQNYNTSKTNKEKIVKKEYFDNLPYEIYINRERYLHDEFISKLRENNGKNYKMLKKNGKTFTDWKTQKKKEKQNAKSVNKKNIEKTENEVIENKITFEQWKKIKLKEKKKEEKKNIELENKKKASKEEKIKKMMDNIEKNKKKQSEFMEKRENKIKEAKKKEEEQKNKEIKERKEKNKPEFINFCVKKSTEKRNNKLKSNLNQIKQNNKYERIQMKEIIGPFYFAKNMREAQKSYYKNINKTNNTNIPKRSNTAKK